MKTKRVMKAAVGILACAMLLASGVSAEPGRSTAMFLTIPVGARSVGLGGAYTALATDAYAMHYNPAGLGAARQEIVFAHNEYVLDLSQEYLAYVHPLNKGAIGASVNYFDLGKFDKTVIVGAVDNPTNYTSRGTFDASNVEVALGYGRQCLVEGLYLGLSAKYIQQNIDVYDGITAAVDLGAYYRKPGSPLSLGVAVLNIGDKVRMQSRNDDLPLTVRVGGAYRLMNERLIIAADMQKIAEDDKYYPNAGAEFWVTPMLGLRLGWDGTTDAGNGLRMGLGVRVEEFSLDYAYGDEDELKQSHWISLGYKF